jgi:hypothetical protein
LIDAILNNLIGNRDKSDKKDSTPKENKEDLPEKVKEDSEQIKDDAIEVRKIIVDDENLKDLYEAREKLNELKRDDKYELTEEEWAGVYEQVLKDKFEREYDEKDNEELETELNKLVEDKKRHGELSREQEMEFKMIDTIYKRKSHEEVRPSDNN